MAPLLRVQYADQLWPTVAEWHDDCLVLIRIHYQPLYVQGNIAVSGVSVINSAGQWVGDPSGLLGPEGLQGDIGLIGPQGLTGAAGRLDHRVRKGQLARQVPKEL